MPHKLPCVIVSTEEGCWTHQSASPLIYVVTGPGTQKGWQITFTGHYLFHYIVYKSGTTKSLR